MTETFLMLVALWCGSPSYTRTSVDEMNKCREQAVQCWAKGKDRYECLSKIKL